MESAGCVSVRWRWWAYRPLVHQAAPDLSGRGARPFPPGELGGAEVLSVAAGRRGVAGPAEAAARLKVEGRPAAGAVAAVVAGPRPVAGLGRVAGPGPVAGLEQAGE